MYAGRYVGMHVYMYVCMYVYMYVCMYVRMYVCMYVCTYVCMYVSMYVSVHCDIYIYTHKNKTFTQSFHSRSPKAASSDVAASCVWRTTCFTSEELVQG